MDRWTMEVGYDGAEMVRYDDGEYVLYADLPHAGEAALAASPLPSDTSAEARTKALDEVRAAVEGLYPDDEGRGSVVTNQSRVHRRAVLATIDKLREAPAPSPPLPCRPTHRKETPDAT